MKQALIWVLLLVVGYFKDSQFNGIKPVEDKGRQFFSKTPTNEESIIGSHFIRLILEAIVFWRQNYGSEDKNNPLHAYNAMHATLAPRVKFPEEFIFFIRSNDLLGGFDLQGLEASSKLEVQANLTIKKEENKQEASHKTNYSAYQIKNDMEVSAHIALSISSSKNYKLNSHLVFNGLAQKSKVYTDSFLKELTAIFTSTEYPPASKFYALYLLAKATEQKNQFLLEHIARQRPLLDKLFRDSQFDGNKPLEDKGRQFFSKTPTNEESMVGNHFIRLILEAIVFWRQNCGSEDKNNPLHAYNAMYAALAPRVKFPEEFIFFTKTDEILNNYYFEK